MAISKLSVIPTPRADLLLVVNRPTGFSPDDEPLWALSSEISQDFLDEEVGFGETIGRTFYTKDLSKLWRSPRLIDALLHHPEALPQIKKLAESRGIRIEKVKVTDVLHCLGNTQDFLWDENIDTIEELITRVFRNADDIDEVVKNDLDTAFLSRYGVKLIK